MTRFLKKAKRPKILFKLDISKAFETCELTFPLGGSTGLGFWPPVVQLD